MLHYYRNCLSTPCWAVKFMGFFPVYLNIKIVQNFSKLTRPYCASFNKEKLVYWYSISFVSLYHWSSFGLALMMLFGFILKWNGFCVFDITTLKFSMLLNYLIVSTTSPLFADGGCYWAFSNYSLSLSLTPDHRGNSFEFLCFKMKLIIACNLLIHACLITWRLDGELGPKSDWKKSSM